MNSVEETIACFEPKYPKDRTRELSFLAILTPPQKN